MRQFASKAEQRRVESALRDKVQAHAGMSESEKIRLRRLITDLEPFTEALGRTAMFLDSQSYDMDCAAQEASKAIEKFTRLAELRLRK